MAAYPRRYQRHGRVFDAGEVASYFNMSAFRAGLDLLLEVGVAGGRGATIVACRIAPSPRSAGGAAASGDRALPPTHRSPMLMLEAGDGLDLARLEADLSARHISVSLRAGRLRLSPGIWNDTSDIDAFVAAVQSSTERLAHS